MFGGDLLKGSALGFGDLCTFVSGMSILYDVSGTEFIWVVLYLSLVFSDIAYIMLSYMLFNYLY